MPITKVIFLGKSKKKTGNTKFMLKALRRRVEKAMFINVPRHKKLFFWTDFQKIIQKKITRANPDLVLIYSKDIPYKVLEDIRRFCITAIFYPDVKVPLDEKLIDISDPASPVKVSSLDTPGQAHGLDVAGELIYVADAWAGLSILTLIDL